MQNCASGPEVKRSAPSRRPIDKDLRSPPGEGLHYQVLEAMKCLRDRERESGIMPLNESLTITRTVSQIKEHAFEKNLLDC